MYTRIMALSLLKGSLLSILSLFTVDSFAQRIKIVEDKDPVPVFLKNQQLNGFFINHFTCSQQGVQILFIQIAGKNAISYYLNADNNSKQKVKIAFKKQSIVSSEAKSLIEPLRFFNDSDTSFGCQYYNFDSDEKEPGAVSTFFAVSEGNKYFKVLFFNTSFENALNTQKEFKILRQAYEYLKSEFSIEIFRLLDG